MPFADELIGPDAADALFALATKTIAPGESIDVRRRHSFRAITTRIYYPGAHAIELQINGIAFGRADFELVDPRA